MLTDMLAPAYPSAFARASRSKKAVIEIANTMGVPDRWIVEIAVMLSQIGWVTMPSEAASRLQRGRDLTPDDLAIVQRWPSVAADLLKNIPGLKAVIDILRHQQKRYDGTGAPHDAVRGQGIPWGRGH
jgi:response regulator RpfG family c-di-GMP phosphodiesterase